MQRFIYIVKTLYFLFYVPLVSVPGFATKLREHLK